MEISRDFIQAEISQVQQEVVRAKTFLVQAETSLAIYQMLLARLDQPDEGKLAELSEDDNLANSDMKPGGTD
ncbi:hypothetical protein UFOVP766_41 [uncultured Caudovirales phage]|uniref:Uncharacterized protein n=1 Tax=uncultured Caudovirales phage TaxID=2100421 RepID=A0A6J5NVH1_9CAUD|nr:hypothetical protein UFOVP766_41 [uncultured Caudovirales phage]